MLLILFTLLLCKYVVNNTM